MKTDKKGKILSKVLFVDDDEIFFNSLKNRVPKNWLLLGHAKDGFEGIKIAQSEKPDLIVTDVMMPKINGFELIRILKSKQETKDIDFIVLSNYGETRLVYDKDFLESLGIKRYLVKSNHTPMEVINEIKNYLA